MFSHEVTATIFVSQKRQPSLCPEPIQWELNPFEIKVTIRDNSLFYGHDFPRTLKVKGAFLLLGEGHCPLPEQWLKIEPFITYQDHNIIFSK